MSARRARIDIKVPPSPRVGSGQEGGPSCSKATTQIEIGVDGTSNNSGAALLFGVVVLSAHLGGGRVAVGDLATRAAVQSRRRRRNRRPSGKGGVGGGSVLEG